MTGPPARGILVLQRWSVGHKQNPKDSLLVVFLQVKISPKRYKSQSIHSLLEIRNIDLSEFLAAPSIAVLGGGFTSLQGHFGVFQFFHRDHLPGILVPPKPKLKRLITNKQPARIEQPRRSRFCCLWGRWLGSPGSNRQNGSVFSRESRN